MQVAGIGRIIFWSGGSLWIGKAFAPSEIHAHHAVQMSMGLSGPIQFKSSYDDPWSFFEAVVIPPDLPHIFQAPEQTIAHIFCEPESVLGRALLRRVVNGKINEIAAADLSPFLVDLRLGYENELPEEELEHIALETLFAFSGSALPAATDSRVTAATAYISRRLAEPLSLAAVATHVGLSPSRFRHLFVKETGISLRSYMLWARLNKALELGFSGTAWTDAAYATHFADSAHLSRTMRRMYGIAPSSVLPQTLAEQSLLTA